MSVKIIAGGFPIVGLRAEMPASAPAGAPYFQTDTSWHYRSQGSTGYTYERGWNVGTDDARIALTMGTVDTGALFLTINTLRIWQWSGTAWVDYTPVAASIPQSNISATPKTLDELLNVESAALQAIFLASESKGIGE